MPITSLIVRSKAGQAQSVAESIGAIPNAEVTDQVGHELVVITDTVDTAEDRRLWDCLEMLPGVLAVDAIYHNFEDMEVG